jgi:peptidoglycan/xylan/chitin deacetylase (PgdA/CDA1 family)
MARRLSIVMYHYIRDFARTRFPGIKGLDLAEFRYQLDYLQQNYHVVTMEDVIGSLRSGDRLPKNATLLTFDDGYAEHYDLAFPILFDRGLQGCFFPPVQPIRDGVMLDVNRLHFILASCDDPAKLGAAVDAAVSASDRDGLDSVANYRDTWAKPNRFDDAETIYVKRMLQTALPEDFRNQIASKLFADYVSNDEAAFANELYITPEQAKVMQGSGMYFGSHGFSHYWLNRIRRETQVAEVDKALDFLRSIGSPVDDFWTMCYPFGGWSEGLLDVLREKDCALGLTTEVATADLDHHEKLTLPRYDTNDFPKKP